MGMQLQAISRLKWAALSTARIRNTIEIPKTRILYSRFTNQQACFLFWQIMGSHVIWGLQGPK